MANVDKDVEALRAATREAHEALKDLRAALRAVRDLLASVRGEVDKQIVELVDPVVKETLETYTAAITAAIGEATEAVYKRFDDIADIMLGEDKKSVRKGEPTLADFAEQRGGLSSAEGFRDRQ